MPRSSYILSIALLMFALALYPAGAMRAAQPPLEIAPLSTMTASNDIAYELPGEDFSLRISYLPEAGSVLSEGVMNAASPGMLDALGNDRIYRSTDIRGQAKLAANYKTSKDLSMRFSYENRLRPKMAEAQSPSSSKLEYGLTYAPSAKSQFNATLKWLHTDGIGGSTGTSKESAEFGYEMKFDGGLMRLGHKTLISHANGNETSLGESSLHTEWSRKDKLSLSADYLSRVRSSGSEEKSKIAGRWRLSQRLQMDFGLLSEAASGAPDKSRQEVKLAADIGTARRPLQLVGTWVEGRTGPEAGSLQQIALNGGWGKPEFNLKFAGKIRRQQGRLSGKEGGELQSLKVETTYERLRLTAKQETFDGETGTVRDKTEYETGFALSPQSEVFWNTKRQAGTKSLSEQSFGLKYKLTDLEFALGHEQKDLTGSGGEWDTARIFWKHDRAVPEWAKPLGERGIFGDSAEFGFRKSPAWAKANQPGVELAWRQRSGESAAADNSLRLVYRGILDKLHLRAGHETNPWQANNNTEKVTIGARDFVEMGLPLNDKLVGLVRLSRNDGLAKTSDGLFVSLGGKLSASEGWECFFSSEDDWSASAASNNSSVYGVVYSNRHSDEQYLTVKAAINPPTDNNQDFGDWRMQLEFAQPF